MKVDFDDLKEKAESAAETEQKVSETVGEASGVPASADEMTLSQMKELMKAEQELAELVAPDEDDKGNTAEVIKELAKDPEIRAGAKQIIGQIKQSGNKEPAVKSSAINQKATGAKARQTREQNSQNNSPNKEPTGDEIVLSPDELFNLTTRMMTNVKDVNPNMTVDDILEYMNENEQLIKQEMKQVSN